MVGSILPIVYGERRDGKWSVSPWLYTLGCAAGGAAFGGALGMVSAVLGMPPAGRSWTTWALLLGGGAQMAYTARELNLARLPLPESTWQVPRRWLHTMPPRAAALAYGVVLGFGILVRMPTSTFGFAALWVFLGGSPWIGSVVFGLFGLGRAVPVLVLAAVTRDAQDASRLGLGLGRWHPIMQLGNGLILAGSGGWLVASAVLA